MNQPTDPQAFHLRPRFTKSSSLDVAVLSKKFEAALKKENAAYDGKVRHGYVSIYPTKKERHYWSPYMTMSMEADEDNPQLTHISCLYGPAPEVWTMFVFFYSFIGLAIVIISVIGFANRSLGESCEILWAIPILILIFISMYGVSYFGQKKGHDQVEGLYNFLNKILDQ